MPDLRFRFECPRAWDDLTGDDRARFCSTCQTTVTNLSALSSAEAEVFLRSRQGRVCVRVEREPGGRVRHWPDLRAAVLATALAACAPGSDDSGTDSGVSSAVATADGRVATGGNAVATPTNNRGADARGVATRVQDGRATAALANRLADAPSKNGHTNHLTLAAATNNTSDHPEWLQVMGYLE